MEINVISGALYTQDGKKIADVKDSSIMLVDEPYKQRTMEVAENIGKTHSITCQLNTSGERLPICGGSWYSTSSAGVFYVYLGNPRASANGGLGFRSAFVN